MRLSFFFKQFEIDRVNGRNIVLICLNILFGLVSVGIITPVLVEIKAFFALNYTAMGFVVSALGITRLLMNLPSGYFSDMFGFKQVLLVGTVINILGCILCAMSTHIFFFVMGRILTGVGVSLVINSSLAYLVFFSSSKNRSTMMSLFTASRMMGAVFYSLLGGWIGSTIGWQAAFYCAVFTGFLSLVFILFLPDNRKRSLQEKEIRADKKTQLYPSTVEKEPKKENRLGIVFTAYFLFFIAYFNHNGFMKSFLVFFGGSYLDLSPLEIGFTLAFSSIYGFVMVLIGGFLADYMGIKAVLTVSLFITGTTNILFSRVFNYPTFIMGYMLASTCVTIKPLATSILMALLPEESIGRVLGLSRFVGDMGFILGPIVFHYVFDCTGYLTTFFCSGGLFFIALFSYLLQKGISPEVK